MDLESLKQEAVSVASKYAGDHPQMSQEVANLIHGGPGGLSGLVQQFHTAGFAAVVQSWVSTGPNQQITAQQIQQVLGNEKVKAIATRLGVDTNVVSQKLAAMLPEVVNHLTPNGQVPVAAADAKG